MTTAHFSLLNNIQLYRCSTVYPFYSQRFGLFLFEEVVDNSTIYIFFCVSIRCAGTSSQEDWQLSLLSKWMNKLKTPLKTMIILLASYLHNTGPLHLQLTTFVVVKQYFTLFPVSPQVITFPHFICVASICFGWRFLLSILFLTSFLLIYKSYKYETFCVANIFYHYFSFCHSFSNIKYWSFSII